RRARGRRTARRVGAAVRAGQICVQHLRRPDRARADDQPRIALGHRPPRNLVLHWVTGRSETHRYDDSLRSIDLVTRYAYEPRLPLSVVVHIDYQRAPSVIQRFGDVKKLITQTLDPMLSAYFRDIAHKKTMLELL